MVAPDSHPLVHLQVFRRDAGTFYTIDDLAAKWHRSRKTVLNYLSLIRGSQYAPSDDQVKRIGPNCARRRVMIREDYAALMRTVFIDRKRPMK